MSSPVGQKRQRRQRAAPSLDQLSVLEEIADDSASAGDGASVQLKPGMTASGRQSRARGATPRELADTFAKLVGGGSVLLAMWVEVEEAALTSEEAQAIAEPLARIINRASWGKAMAKRLIGADDYLALSLALFSYGVRVYPLILAKGHDVAQSRRTAPPIRTQQQQQPAEPARQPESNGHYDPGTGVKFDPTSTRGFGWGAE